MTKQQLGKEVFGSTKLHDRSLGDYKRTEDAVFDKYLLIDFKKPSFWDKVNYLRGC